jgi:surfeit locus 1 family protein
MTLNARRWLVLMAAVLTATLTARLGLWQLDRADQKNRLQANLQTRAALPPVALAELARDALTAAEQQHRLVVLEGQWQPRFTVYLDNRQMNARPGFFAVTPLLLDDGTAVLVQRGWLPRNPSDRTRVSPPLTAEGRVQVQGRLALAPSRLFEFGAGTETGAIRQNLLLEDFALETGLKLRPLSVLQLDAPGASSSSDGLLRQWLVPAANVDKHYGYAAQWFALSALSIGLYAWFQIIRPRRQLSQSER